MSSVAQIKQMCSGTQTAYLLGMAEAAKRRDLSILEVMSIDEIGQIDMSFIEEIRDNKGQGDAS